MVGEASERASERARARARERESAREERGPRWGEGRGRYGARARKGEWS